MHSSSPAGLAQHHRDHGPSAIHTGLAFERVVLLHRHEAIPLVEGHVPRVRRLEVAAQPRGIRAVQADLEQLRADTLALRCGRRAYELQVVRRRRVLVALALQRRQQLAERDELPEPHDEVDHDEQEESQSVAAGHRRGLPERHGQQLARPRLGDCVRGSSADGTVDHVVHAEAPQEPPKDRGCRLCILSVLRDDVAEHRVVKERLRQHGARGVGLHTTVVRPGLHRDASCSGGAAAGLGASSRLL